MLGRWEDASWHPIDESSVREFPLSPQRFYKELRTGESSTDGSRTPEFISTLSHSASLESNLGGQTTTSKDDAGEERKDSAAGGYTNAHDQPPAAASSATMRLAAPAGEEGSGDGAHHHDSMSVHTPSTRLRCPVVRECTVEVDLRWPYQLVTAK